MQRPQAEAGRLELLMTDATNNTKCQTRHRQYKVPTPKLSCCHAWKKRSPSDREQRTAGKKDADGLTGHSQLNNISP